MFGKKRQIKDEAASLLRKGKYEKALELFRKLAEADPDDYSSRRNLGYILRKLGRKDEAVEVFEKLANEYANDGFLLKAIATCKVVLEMDPNHKATQERLADLYSRRTSTPSPEIKVMADVDSQGKVSAGFVPAQSNSQDKPLDIPDDDGTFEIQRTTSPEDVFGMVELEDAKSEAEPKKAQNLSEDHRENDYIEMIELEPIELEPIPFEKQEPTQESASELDEVQQLQQAPASPVVGTLIQQDDESGKTVSGQSGLETEKAADTAESLSEPETEKAPDKTDSLPEIEPVPADKLDLESKTESKPARAASETNAGVSADNADFDIDIDIDIEMDAMQAEPKKAALAPEIPLFCDLEPDAFVSLLEQMKLVRMTKGQWVLKEGQAGTSMFTVARGKVRVLKRIAPKKQLQLAVLGEGTFFGEMALLRGGTRGASVQCTESGELFEISRELMDEVTKKHPAVEKVVEKFAQQRLLRNVMATSPLFRPFGKKERIRIVENFVSRQVPQGDVVIREGKESDGLYLVLRGQMDVYCQTEDGNDIEVGVLREGDVFGEISCLRKDPAIATVKAKTNASVLRLPRDKFDTLVISHPQILELISELSDERLAKTSNLLAEKGILI